MAKTKDTDPAFFKAGQKGGKATLKKFGKDHYRKIALKRWAKHKSSA